jgi:sugar phosphate permease
MAMQERAAESSGGSNPYEAPSQTPPSSGGRPATAWIVTWLAYASYYAGRKGFSVSKKTIRDDLGVSESALGAIDTVYLTAYAAGQFVSGALGDRIGSRRLITVGMLISAAACGAFGSVSTAIAFGVFFTINGFAQATGWPGTTRAMAEWTTLENRGSVMAFWATCYQVGGLAASWACGFLLAKYGWRSTFVAPAIWMALIALLVHAFLRPGPGAEVAREKDGLPPTSEDLAKLRREAQRRVLRSPALWSYGASYFFIKFVRYAILFWMPYYLANTLKYERDDAAFVSTAFEVGGTLGVIAIGSLSDRVRRFSRPALSLLSLVGLGFALLLYWRVETSGWVANVLALSLIGALLFAPDSLLSGASAQDAGGPHAAAMATGMVNGVGSVGAILVGAILPQLSKSWGWGVLFPVLAGMAFCAAIALVPSLFAKKVY